MKWPRRVLSTRGKVLPVAVFTFGAAFLLYSATLSSTTTVASADSFTTPPEVSAPAATFPGTGVGAIPDGGSGCGPSPGAARDVTFTAAGLSGSPTAVDINMTFGSPVHTFIGDVSAILIAPNGASHTVFARTGATTATAFGGSSDLGATYNFSDTAPAPPSGGWWQEETVRGAAEIMTAGTYRTTASGGAGATNPQPPTSINAAFAAVPNANGTWTLRLTDGCGADTGAITAANLTITAGATVAADAPIDFNGDGKTDYAVVRNTGGGPGGQVTWFILPNGGGAISGAAWGISTDFYVPEDYDGDLKDDIAVWRPGPAGSAFWYILQSNGNTMRSESFGQTNDDPTVVGDYNNDGKADLAVYRSGAAAGDPSTWFFRTSPGGPTNFVPWGQNGDFPAPGDYDGDGKNDFVIQRNNGAGQARFWMSQTTAGFNMVVFGTPTDVIVPGDYDGDGKTDIATIRTVGANIGWFIRPSSTGVISGSPTALFGSAAAGDLTAQGDYDGDGKTDIAIWRPNADPTMCNFWSLNSSNGAATVVEWGQNGDFPVANYNRH
jgi:hypothetical protein